MKKLPILFVLFLSAICPVNAQTPNVYDMPMTGTAVYTTCSGNFYDVGGAGGNYTDTENSTITFYPLDTVHQKISISFSSFSTFGQYDYLTVYNGASTSSPHIANLFGQVAPGTIISTASNGSLTFQFTASNLDDGVSSGWAASITCVAPLSMPASGDITMIASGKFQTCSGNFYDIGGTNGNYIDNQDVDITIYPVDTINQKLSVSFSSFSTVSQNDYLFVYNGSNKDAPRIANLFGEIGPGTIISTATNGSLTFHFSSDNLDGVSSGWAASISCVAAMSIPASGNVTAIASGIYKTCSANFYDIGGPSGNYIDNQSVTVTFYPEDISSQKLSATFTSFSTFIPDDHLRVYNGNSVVPAALLADLSGNAVPGTFTSTAADGSLTFYFSSVNLDNGVGSGWAASISCSGSSTNMVAIDPNPSLVFPAGLLNTDLTGLDQTKIVHGAVTDGITKVLIQVQTASPCTIAISGDPGNLGTLSNLTDQTNQLQSVTVVPQNGVATAVYTVPDGYGNGLQSNERIVTFTSTDIANPSDVRRLDLSLSTPPVILVHGMWSDPSVWEDGGFVKTLNNAGFGAIYKADYRDYSSYTFDPLDSQSIYGILAIADQVDTALNYYKKREIAISQVDLVCHSLGGLLARSWSQQPTFAPLFVNRSNYSKGYFHKLITLGTPHRGSPLGPILWDNRNRIVIFRTYHVNTVGDLMKHIGDPIGLVHRDFGKDSPGVIDLSPTPVFHTYSVTGNYSGAPFVSAENFAYFKLDLLMRLFLRTTHNQTFTVAPCTTTSNNDLIVEVNSQTGGISQTQNFIGVSHSIISPTDRYTGLVTETNDSAIQRHVADLLLSDDNSLFGSGFPSPDSIATDCNNGTSSIAGNNKSTIGTLSVDPNQQTHTLDTNKYVQLISPLRGSLYSQNSNSTITLQANAVNIAALDSPLFIINGVVWFAAPMLSPYTVSFSLPANTPVGSMPVIVLVKDTSGLLYADTSSIVITPQGTLDSISGDPANVRLDSTYRERLMHVTGYFNVGSTENTVDLTGSSTGTIYKANKGGIFSIDPDGKLTALSPGNDTLIISNSSQVSKISVGVDNNFRFASKFNNSINFPAISGPFYLQQPFGLSAWSTSGDSIHFTIVSGPAILENGVLTITGPGRITVKASDAGNVYFAAATDVEQSFCFLSEQTSPIGGDTVTCVGAATYTVRKIPGITYQWSISEGGTIRATDTSAIISWADDGVHTITVTPGADSCFGNAQTLQVRVMGPEKPFIKSVNGFLFSSSDSGNQWYLSSNAISGATDSLYHPMRTGEYTVQVTLNGCASPFADPFAFSNTNDLDSNVHVFPNPFSSVVTISNYGNDPLHIQLLDITGRRIFVMGHLGGTQQLNTGALASGCYLLEILDEMTNNKKMTKLIKMQ